MTVKFLNVKSEGQWKQGAIDCNNTYVGPPVWFRSQLWMEVQVMDLIREYVALYVPCLWLSWRRSSFNPDRPTLHQGNRGTPALMAGQPSSDDSFTGIPNLKENNNV